MIIDLQYLGIITRDKRRRSSFRWNSLSEISDGDGYKNGEGNSFGYGYGYGYGNGNENGEGDGNGDVGYR